MKYTFIVVMAVLTVVFAGSLHSASVRFGGYGFKAFVVRSGGGHYAEFFENSRTLLKVGQNEEYSIVVYNPLPVRVAVAVSIDGLNSIDGKRTTLRNARKWLIEPHSSITVSGWQTGLSTMRKFIFTEQTASYAQWKEDRDGKKYTRNLGVIGIAWFWNAEELENVLRPPQPFDDEAVKSGDLSEKRKDSAPQGARSESRAGTGMGSQERHDVTEVEFYDNAGMYAVRDVMKIYYEFAKNEPAPQPFVDDDEVAGNFAPDMYK